MKVQTVAYVDGKWSRDLPTDLDSESTFILIFGNPENAVNELIEAFPKSQLMGCSTAGEIFDNRHYVNTVQASIVKFDKTRVRVIEHEFSDYDQSYDAGEQVMKALQADDLQALFILGTGFMNGDQLSKGLAAQNSKHVPVGGGLAGDPNIKDTWTISRKGIRRSSVMAVGFYGNDLDFIVRSISGCTPLGVERTVTKSDKNVLYEVDGKPVTEFYKEFLGDKINQFNQLPIQFPVAISKDYKVEEGELIRTPFGINQEENSITYTGEIPEGSTIRLMIAGQDSLVDGSEQAVERLYEAHQKIPENEYLIIPVSCLTRKLVLGELVEDEIETIRDRFESEKYVVNGFYAFGEIATDQKGECSLHNQTMNLILLYEK